MGQQLGDELNIYKRIQGASQSHRGRRYVRSLLDTFDVNGPEYKHRCLVHPPLWESVLDFLHRNPVRRLPPPIVAVTLHRLFLALDYLHTECKVIHTDIKADNLMFGIDDDSVFHDFEENELRDPCPRKELDGRTIYTSRELKMPKDLDAPVLCDFGSAVLGDEEHSEDIQPNIYRAPEVILEVPWTYSVDIWNAGCVIWNIFEGGGLFSGQDPEFQTYRSRAHLAEMIRLLGPPPPDLLKRGVLTPKFFSEEGGFTAGVPLTIHRQLAADPSNVVIGLVRNTAATEEEVSKEIPGGNVHLVESAVAEVEKVTSSIDHLVANATRVSTWSAYEGIGDLAAKSPKQLDEDLLESIRVNVLGNIHLFSLFLPLIKRGNAKKVITITSGMADIEFISAFDIAAGAPDSISKAAMNATYAKFSAQYKEDGILFLGVSPGLVDTGSYDNLAVLETIHRADFSKGYAGGFVSHYGNKQWL
ncbi:hypothetical protein N8T08_009174 [Aspergillus melleus]|uniref:Uncharacterized protein n=1 Tax=Aspergillus melleus TaxID=138277 RepID=A0ACC3AUK5_9EURO|nr:hypothetical protein N8T08_009174 [Aspergillus melleus]